MHRALAALAALAMAATLGSACARPTTITLVVTSDVPCADLRGVSITAATPADVDTRNATTVTARCESSGTESRVGSLVIVPGSSDEASIAVRVVAGIDRPAAECSAEDAFAGCVVARRIVRFVPNDALVVGVALRAACRNMVCDSQSTCVRGACRSATLDPARCKGAGCDEDALPAGPDGLTPPGPPLSDAGNPDAAPDATVTPVVPCAAHQKSCGGKCVAKDDPQYGCSEGICESCAGNGVSASTCSGAMCVLTGCVPGYKLCGGNCVPADAAHGCSGASCTACESTNGTPTCDSTAACTIVCNPGSKLCGGRCVSTGDPTYGCGVAGCSAAACPDPGTGTLVCNAGVCEVGTCGPGTKKCGNACVPTDANNGCETVGRCTPCAAGEACSGANSTCACVPEPAATTCASKACGTAVNNCGQTVTCTNTCSAPSTCGGGGAGPNGCGCTPDNAAACAGKACGTAVNNCGQTIACTDTCVAPMVCGAAGAGPNACGCVPDDVAACAGKACGPAVNNCGQAITCANTCTGYNKCGGGSAGPNGCGCTPIPKSQACEEPCGYASNGCGGSYYCGKICY